MKHGQSRSGTETLLTEQGSEIEKESVTPSFH